MTTTLFETSLIGKELKDVTTKHEEIVKQMQELVEIIKAKNQELQTLKEHGLVLTGAKAILESLQKSILDQDIEE